MPELPEVETVKETLKKLILGYTIKDIEVYYDKIIKNVSPDLFVLNLKGQTFRDIKRRGKYLLFVLDDITLVSHLRMEGKYFLKDKTEERNKHEHIIFILDDNTTLRYHDTRKFGDMFLFQTNNIEDVIKSKPVSKLGREPFDDDFTLAYLKKRISKSSKAIKTVLLDQTIVAGLGNIYVDEVCFMSNIHPEQKANTLREEEILLIIESSKMVLKKAISLGGTTIRSFMSSHDISGRFQNELLVHTKKICPKCDSQILKIRVGGRGTYFCEKCQKLIDKEVKK